MKKRMTVDDVSDMLCGMLIDDPELAELGEATAVPVQDDTLDFHFNKQRFRLIVIELDDLK